MVSAPMAAEFDNAHKEPFCELQLKGVMFAKGHFFKTLQEPQRLGNFFYHSLLLYNPVFHLFCWVDDRAVSRPVLLS